MKIKAFLSFCFFLLLFAGCATTPEQKPANTARGAYEQAMVFFKNRNFLEAVPAFEDLRGKYPLSPYAVLAELRLGDAHYAQDQFVEAQHYFENFRRLHPSNPQVAYSIYMTGMCQYQQILSLDRDQTFAEAAVEQFQQLVELYPKSPYAGLSLCKMWEAKKRIAAHEFFIGNFYLKQENYNGAIARFDKALKKYTKTIENDKLLFYIGDATLRSGDARRGKKILAFLLDKFPDGPYAARSQALIDAPAPAPPAKEKKHFKSEEPDGGGNL